ncbi:unnamed protein product, partial [Linum tenue]
MLMILVNSPFLQGELHWLHLWLHHNNILKHCRPNGFPCFEQSHWRDLIELQQPILEGIELVYNLGVSELNYTLKLSPSPRKCTVLLLLDDNVVLFRLTVFCNVRLLFEKGDKERRKQERERLKQEKKWKKKKEKKRNKRNRKKNNNGSNDGGSLPRFGDWDESDPSSADGYSAIFDIVRKEKNTGFCVRNMSFKLADQIKTRRRGRLRRFLKSLKGIVKERIKLGDVGCLL